MDCSCLVSYGCVQNQSILCYGMGATVVKNISVCSWNSIRFDLNFRLPQTLVCWGPDEVILCRQNLLGGSVYWTAASVSETPASVSETTPRRCPCFLFFVFVPDGSKQQLTSHRKHKYQRICGLVFERIRGRVFETI